MACEIFTIQTGYSNFNEDGFMVANATCSIVKSPENILIVDTLTPWDGEIILKKLKELEIEPSQITYVISTHGHPDHTGNNHLFLSAKQHIVGFCIFQKDQFYLHPFEQDVEFEIDEWIKLIPTPGHSNEDISIVVQGKDIKIDGVNAKNSNKGTSAAAAAGPTVILSGDLFEREDDVIEDESLWIGNSFNPKQQAKNRLKVLEMADVIIPGHGSMFPVQAKYIEAAKATCFIFDSAATDK